MQNIIKQILAMQTILDIAEALLGHQNRLSNKSNTELAYLLNAAHQALKDLETS